MTRGVHLAFALRPFSGTKQVDLDHLVVDLAASNVTTARLPAIELPDYAFDARRRQYDAEALLEWLAARERDSRILGVADVDLYVPRFNFVLGLAKSPGRAAVISLARLHHRDPAVFRTQAVKEAVHEIGHTFGLGHSPIRGA